MNSNEVVKNIQQQLNTFQIHNIPFKNIVTYSLSKKKGEISYQKKINYIFEGQVELDHHKGILEIQKYLEETPKPDHINIQFKFFPKFYELGDSLKMIKSVTCINSDKKIDIELRNQVTILILWSLKNAQSQTTLQNLQNAAAQNIWKDKVKIISLSIDELNESVKSKVNQKAWNQIEHYSLQSLDQQHHIIQGFKIRVVPYVALFDQNCKIIYKGHPNQGDLINKINQLQNQPIEIESHQNQSQQNIQLKSKGEKNLYKHQKNIIKSKEFQDKFHHADDQYEIELIKQRIFTSEQSFTQYQLSTTFQGKPTKISEFIIQNLIKFDIKVVPFRHFKNIQGRFLSEFEKRSIFNQILFTLTKKYEMDQYGHRENTRISLDHIFKANQYDEVVEAQDYLKKQFRHLEQGIEENQHYEQFQDLIQQNLNCSYRPGDQVQNIQAVNVHNEIELTIPLDKGKIILFIANSIQINITPQIEKIKKLSLQYQKKFIFLYNNDNDKLKQISIENKLKESDVFYIKYKKQKFVDLFQFSQDQPKIILIENGIFQDTKKYPLIHNIANVSTLVSEWDLVGKQAYKKLKQWLKSSKAATIEEDFIKKTGYQLDFQISIRKKLLFSLFGYSNPPHYEIIKPKIKIRDIDNEFLFSYIEQIAHHVQVDFTPTITLKYGDKCSLCSNLLEHQKIQFYNYFEEEHICFPCGNKTITDNQGREKYLISDNLILIDSKKEENLKVIDQFRLGSNIQPQKGEEGKQKHEYCCDGCGKSPLGSRYICLNCKPGVQEGRVIDFCGICVQNIQKRENFQLKTKDLNHNSDHLYLRIQYDVYGYHKY